MSSPATDLRFHDAEQRFGRYNFQRPEHLQALVRALGGDDPGFSGNVELCGAAGSGRAYLLEAARHRLGGGPVPVWIGQDYQPDNTNPADYLERLHREQGSRWPRRLAALIELAQALPRVDERLTLALSLLLQLPAPLEQLLAAFREGDGLRLHRPVGSSCTPCWAG